MSQTPTLITTSEISQLECLDKEALLQLVKVFQSGYANAVQVNHKLAREVEDLRARLQISGEQVVLLQNQLVVIRHEQFGRSSERTPLDDAGSVTESVRVPGTPRRKPQLPSVRFPQAEIIESRFTFKDAPACTCCQSEMIPMGQQEVSEEVDVVPRKFFIRRILREKYRCKRCQGSIRTAPGPEKLVSGGSYSAEFAIEVAEQKYAHHVPIERLRKQFEVQGLCGIEGPTLIEQTHHLAERLRGVYRAIRKELLEAPLLHADETPWRMLEGSEKKSWYLWGYGSKNCIFYQARDSRSSDGPAGLLRESKARFLMVDGYTGYSKALREEAPGITAVHCWAHARRKFIEAEKVDSRAKPAVAWINELYALEHGAFSESDRASVRKRESQAIVAKLRDWAMQERALPKSLLGKAIDYLFRYWEGLTRFLEHPEIPLDNNFAERSLRGPVLGRKNFYGNHSVRAAETSAILYSVSETCKLNGVSFSEFVRHSLRTPQTQTPAQYALISA